MTEPFTSLDTIRQFGSRDARRHQAKLFRDSYPDKSLGITWVAVQGMDSLCVVTRNDDLVHLEHELLLSGGRHTTDSFLRLFWNAIVCEVEGIENSMSGGCRKRPFSVVNVLKRSGQVECCAEMTNKFLRGEIKSGTTFDFDKTVQTAISAFQHLFPREFEADEIRVFVRKDVDIIGKEMQQINENSGLEELQASMNEPDNDPDTVD